MEEHKTPVDAPPPYHAAPAGYPPATAPGYAPQQYPGYPPQSAPGQPPQPFPGYHQAAPAGYGTSAGYQPVSGGAPMYQPAPGFTYPQTTATVTTVASVGPQPTIMLAPPPNYAVMAWLSCLFCFWPLGIAAIIKSSEVDSATRQGDLNRATEASRSARLYSLISIGIGIGAYIVGIISIIVLVTASASRVSYYNSNY